MKKETRIKVKFYLSLMFIIVASMATNAFGSEWKPDKKFLTIVSTSPGGSWYAIAGKMAEVITTEKTPTAKITTPTIGGA